MNVMTSRFGEIEIDENKIIEMPDGMLGFPDRLFVVLSPGNQGPFFWFQSLDNPELAFVVTDPISFIQGYEVNLTPDEYQRIMLKDDSEVIILAVVTVANEVAKITLNLQGPVVVNPLKMLAKQIVLEEGKYSTKHPLFDVPLVSMPQEEAVTGPSLEKIATICRNH
jgi:flagellar assembly factor FliW